MKLYIDDKIFSNFSSYTIALKYNAIASSFRFDALKDFLPPQLTYPLCQVIDDESNILITGTATNYVYSLQAISSLDTISGYSKPGILEDCNIPPSLYPLQVDKLSLKQIVDKILPVFGLEYVADDSISEDFNKTYPKSNANLNFSIKEYLNNLASQKSIILSHNEEGKLVFTKIATDQLTPVATFEEGNEGVNIYTLNVDGQVLHSHITVMKQASSIDASAGEATVENPMVGIFRPKVKLSTSGSVFDVEKAARMELSAELSSIKFIINTTKFVKPGQLIQLKAPTLNINDFVPLFVEQTTIKGGIVGETYTILCVMPEVYNLEPVVNIFS